MAGRCDCDSGVLSVVGGGVVTLEEKIDELERLEKAATPGPWRSSTWYGIDGGWAAVGPHHEPLSDEDSDEPDGEVEDRAKNDAAFIAAARNHLPDILAALKEAQAKRFQHEDAVALADACLERDDLRAKLETATEALREIAAIHLDMKEQQVARSALARIDGHKPGGRDLGGGTLTFPGEPPCPKRDSPCAFDALDRVPTCVWCGDKHAKREAKP